MIDVHETNPEVELTLTDGRWIEIYNIDYDPGERGNTQGLPENCWPEVPASVTFDALVGDSEDDSNIKRVATSDEMESIYEDVLTWYEEQLSA